MTPRHAYVVSKYFFGQQKFSTSRQSEQHDDTSEQINCLNKHKGKAEQDKAGTERDLQEARQGLDEAMRDNANIEKNCKMIQGSIAAANFSLVNIARSVNDVDIVKKKLTVE